jgi:hypothetical protein
LDKALSWWSISTSKEAADAIVPGIVGEVTCRRLSGGVPNVRSLRISLKY